MTQARSKKDGKGSVKQGGQVGSRPTGDAGKSFGKKFGKRQEKRRRKFFGREKIEQREGREGKLPNQKRNRKNREQAKTAENKTGRKTAEKKYIIIIRKERNRESGGHRFF